MVGDSKEATRIIKNPTVNHTGNITAKLVGRRNTYYIIGSL
jgi:hypothetical protein